MTNDIKHLRETIKISLASRAAGNHPFGSLLVGPDGEILIRCGNTHAADKALVTQR